MDYSAANSLCWLRVYKRRSRGREKGLCELQNVSALRFSTEISGLNSEQNSSKPKARNWPKEEVVSYVMGPTVEFTRPRDSGHFELIKHLEKHAIAARVQRFVGFRSGGYGRNPRKFSSNGRNTVWSVSKQK